MAASSTAVALRVWLVLAVVSGLTIGLEVPTGAALPDTQPCPEACSCRYSRIFWETDCSRRELEVVPEGLSLDVHALDLTGNKLEKVGPFPEGCRLRRLLARENRVRSVAAADLGGLDLLVEVDLSQNQLTELDPTTFRNASGLFTLNLANNQLEAPAGPLVASESLKNLDLHGNRLRALSGSAFMNCSSLAALDLSDNPLGALPAAALAPLTGLETLSVARCGLEALDPVALAPLAQLKALDASGNALGAAGRWAPALRPLARLDALTLSQAALEGPLPADAFATCASLRRLALSDNPLLRDPWPAAAALFALGELEVRGCGLRALPPAELRGNLSALRLLDASDNALGPQLPRGALALPALETLRLARCGLRAPPDSRAFQEEDEENSGEPTPMPALEEVSLAGNPLSLPAAAPLFPATAQGALHSLDLSNCSLREVPAAALRGALNLTDLLLHDNPLEQVPEDALRELPALMTLDLRSCRLRSMRSTQLAHSPRLRALRLRGNPWLCSCALRGVWEWAVQGKGDLDVLEGARNLTCTPPEGKAKGEGEDEGEGAKVETRRWEELPAEDLDCPEALAVSRALNRRAAPPGVAVLVAAASPGRAGGGSAGVRQSLLHAAVGAAALLAAVLGSALLVRAATAARRHKCCAPHRRLLAP